MDQLGLFGDAGQSIGIPGDVIAYYPRLFDREKSAGYLGTFITTIPWEQRVVRMYGKEITTPRLTAWFGDAKKSYAYSGNKFSPIPWTRELMEIKARVEPLACISFNSVLLNYYRDGNDSVAWHSDNEKELGRQPVIASVSFGAVRQFDIRKKTEHTRKFSIRLEDGSLLLMKGDLQQNWDHRIPKLKTLSGARVNLTYRVIQ